jgi:hypothetical protein
MNGSYSFEGTTKQLDERASHENIFHMLERGEISSERGLTQETSLTRPGNTKKKCG